MNAISVFDLNGGAWLFCLILMGPTLVLLVPTMLTRKVLMVNQYGLYPLIKLNAMIRTRMLLFKYYTMAFKSAHYLLVRVFWKDYCLSSFDLLCWGGGLELVIGFIFQIFHLCFYVLWFLVYLHPKIWINSTSIWCWSYYGYLNWKRDPELAQAILGNDLNRLQDILRARNRQKSELRRQQEEEMVSIVSAIPSSMIVSIL